MQWRHGADDCCTSSTKMQSDQEVSHLIPLEVILGEYPSLLPEVALNFSCFPPEAAAEDASAAELSSNSCIWFVSRTMVSSFTWRNRGNENIFDLGYKYKSKECQHHQTSNTRALHTIFDRKEFPSFKQAFPFEMKFLRSQRDSTYRVPLILGINSIRIQGRVHLRIGCTE